MNIMDDNNNNKDNGSNVAVFTRKSRTSTTLWMTTTRTMTAMNIVDDNDYKNNNYNESYVKIENFIIKLTQYLSSWT